MEVAHERDPIDQLESTDSVVDQVIGILGDQHPNHSNHDVKTFVTRHLHLPEQLIRC
jgi:hypothetical protein